jgi:hypothetical protein
MEISGLFLYLKYFTRHSALRIMFVSTVVSPLVFIFMPEKASAVQSIFKMCLYVTLFVLSSYTVKDEKKGALFHFPCLFYSRKEIFCYRVMAKYLIFLTISAVLYFMLLILNNFFTNMDL